LFLLNFVYRFVDGIGCAISYGRGKFGFNSLKVDLQTIMASNSPRSVNYREIHFEFPTLTPIRGEPAANSLIILRNQLKANARSVPSNLGGGTLGHLGLVLSPTNYVLTSDVLFVCPTHPGPLTIPHGTSRNTAINMRLSYGTTKGFHRGKRR